MYSEIVDLSILIENNMIYYPGTLNQSFQNILL